MYGILHLVSTPQAGRLAHLWLHSLASLLGDFQHEHFVKLSWVVLWWYIGGV